MSYFYLASPYTHFPGGREAAFREVCSETARLIERGVTVFSPIVHSHPLCAHGALEKMSHTAWMLFDEHFMRQARGLIVLKMAGWRTSKGVQMELDYFIKKTSKPIVFMDPGETPFELMKVDLS